jgi:protein-S-isoprenylcysteine O-methyltransferase Ste14
VNPLVGYFISLLITLGAAFVVFRVFVRNDYKRLGKLSPFSGILEGLIWALFISFPFLYNPPQWMFSWSQFISTPQIIIGLIILTLGIILAFSAMGWLGLGRSFGQEANTLKDFGYYRFTRNPQILGGALMVAGVSILWPSWYELGWIGLYGIIGHLMVLTEEEYLANQYGEKYAAYCARVPRYIGWKKRN